MTDVEGLPTALDFLRSQMAQRKAAEERRVPLRDTVSRPEIVVTVRIPREAAELLAVEKAAVEEESRNVPDSPPGSTILAAMTLARFATQVSYSGLDQAPGDGSAFSYPPLMEALGAKRAWQAVRALYDDDFALTRVFRAFQREAGILAPEGAVVVSEADPT